MNRVISTTLVANVSGYVGGMHTASAATTSFAARATSAINTHAQSMTRVGIAAAAMGAAIGLALRSAARDNIAFEAALTRSVTLIGVSRREMDQMGQAALRMAQTGRGPLELADALFFIQSAGLRGATALDTLEQSAKASSVGLGETKVVADLATSAMNAYGSENLSASQAIDVMIGAVREGKAEAEDLAGAMGRVLPIASEMGVSFEEVGAATAAMTRTGSDASTATTQLRAILVSMLNPSRQAERALQGIGLSSQLLRDTIREQGLWEAMMMLRDAIGDNDAVLGQVIPNVRALTGFLDLTGASAEANAEIFANMNDTMGLGEEAFETWSETAEASISRFTAAAEAARIASMEGLAGPLSAVLDAVTGLFERYTELPAPIRQTSTALLAVFAAVGLLGGGLLILLPRIVATRAAMASLALAAPRAAAGMRMLMLATGVGAALLAAAAAFTVFTRASDDFRQGAGTTELALRNLASGIEDDFINKVENAHNRLDDTIEIFGVRLSTTWGGEGSVIGRGTRAANDFAAGVQSIDEGLASLVTSGDIDTATAAVRELGRRLNLSGGELDAWVQEHLPQYLDALDGVEAGHVAAADSMDPVEEGLTRLGERFGVVGDDIVSASQQMVDAWQDAAESFISLTDAHGTVFDRLMEKEREAAENAAEAAGDGVEAWEDYVGEVKVAIGDIIEELEKQVEAQRDWATNLAIITARGVDETLYDHLVRLGPEGAAIVQAFAEATDDEFRRAESLWVESTGIGVTSVARRLAEAGPVLDAIARELGQDVADNIAQGMVDNGTTVEQEAHRQGVNIDRVLSNYGEVEITPELNNRALQQVGRSLDDLAKDRTMTITARLAAQASTGSQGINIGQRRGGPTGFDLDPNYHREHGGPVLRGQPYVVGERRPELFVPEQNGYIVPRVPKGWDAHGGFGYKQHVTLKNDLDATDFMNLVQAAAAKAASTMLLSGGRVLPRGSYRIGRGSAAHGYGAIDLPAPIGTPIYALAAGIVTRAARLATSYGIHSFINHAGGVQTRYAHKSQMYVSAGQQVNKGQLIGRVGSTGNSTGPHLHFEYLVNGVRRQPERMGIFDRGGLLKPGWTSVWNGTGGPEAVLDNQTTRLLLQIASQRRGRPDSGGLMTQTVPDEFFAHAVIDLGEGIEQVATIKFRRHDRELKERIRARTGVM